MNKNPAKKAPETMAEQIGKKLCGNIYRDMNIEKAKKNAAVASLRIAATP